MKKSVARTMLLAVVAGGLQLSALAPAEAQVSTVANGRRCGFTSVTDPTIEDGDTQTGQINAGPLVAADAGATIAITCTIQVGAANSAHSGVDAVSVTATASVQVSVLSPSLASYVSPEGQPVYMCSSARINGTLYYWDASANAGAGDWTTSSGGLCNEAISQEIFPGPLEPVLILLDELVFCPALIALAPGVPGVVDIDPATGDTYVNGEFFWDCPPYEA